MFLAHFFFTNGVTCPALWRHLSSHPRQFSIFEDVGGWQLCPFHLWTNECNKIDTRLTENMRSRQNGPGRSNMASKPWNRLAYRTVTTLCTVHKKTQIVCVLLRRNAISAWNTFNLRLSETKKRDFLSQILECPNTAARKPGHRVIN